jgi:hypothetical protein
MAVIFNTKVRLIDHEQQIIVAYNVHPVIIFVQFVKLAEQTLINWAHNMIIWATFKVMKIGTS